MKKAATKKNKKVKAPPDISVAKGRGRFKPTKHQARNFFVEQLFCLLGCILNAAAVKIFILPNLIAQNGITGIAALVSRFSGGLVPLGMANLALNIPLVILALIFLGWKFVSKSLVAVLEFSIIVDLMGSYMPYTYTDDRLLAAVFAGVFGGAGASLILSRGFTAGGLETLTRLIQRKWPHIPYGTVNMLISSGIVLVGALVYRDINAALYAAIMIFINTRIVDAILYGMNNGKVFYIFSGKAEELAKAVLAEIERGASILPATGAFTGEQQNMLMCVVRRSEVTALRRIVRERDPRAFMVIAEAQEVFGGRFKRSAGE